MSVLRHVAVFFAGWLFLDAVLVLTRPVMEAAGAWCGDRLGLWLLRRAVLSRRLPLLQVDREVWSYADVIGTPGG